MALQDDAKLISEYLQWRAVREVVVPDYSPEEFMRERVQKIAVDRLEDAIDYINTRIPRRTDNGEFSDTIKGLLAILEGTDGEPAETKTDREDTGQESSAPKSDNDESVFYDSWTEERDNSGE